MSHTPANRDRKRLARRQNRYDRIAKEKAAAAAERATRAKK